MITILFSKFLVDFLRNNIRRLGLPSCVCSGELKVAFLRAVILNPLSANITKWSNTQTIHRQFADELFECV